WAEAWGVGVGLADAIRAPETLASRLRVPAAAADTGYQRLLSAAVESARVAVCADAAFAMMPDEDGDLRLAAAAGSISLPGGDSVAGAPSVAGARSAACALAVFPLPFVLLLHGTRLPPPASPP